MALMKRKRLLSLVILLLVVGQIGFAAVATRPSWSVGLGGSFCYPTADYLKQYPGNPEVKMPSFRTSRLLTMDLEFINIAYTFGKNNESAIRLGFGISYINVSKSFSYGISVLKPYNGVGFLADMGWRINSHFDVGVRYRLFQCFFSGSSARFIAHEVEFSPSYIFANLKAVEFSVGLPVAVLWKADSISVNASVALSVNIDSLGIKRRR